MTEGKRHGGGPKQMLENDQFDPRRCSSWIPKAWNPKACIPGKGSNAVLVRV